MAWLRLVVVAEVILAAALFAVRADSAAVALTLALWALRAVLGHTSR